MNIKNNLSSFILLFFLVFLLGSCAADKEHRLEETLIFAGKNRAELEKVLLHFNNDSLKLEAARFLLIHMKDRHSFQSAGIDSVRQALIETSNQQGFMERKRRDKWRIFSYKDSPKVYDAQVITADYLIENIDLAFEAWRQREWNKYCPFDDFCTYLLPYWTGNEVPDHWRRIYRDRFQPVLDSLYQGTDIVVAVDSLQSYLRRNMNFCYNNDFSFPHVGGTFILEHPIGTCREETDFLTYLFRALGISVAVDRYIYSPNTFLGHSWNVFRDTTGLFIPTELQRTGVSRKWVNHRCKGKVYRTFSTPQKQPSIFGNLLKDVTSEYYPKNNIQIDGIQSNTKEGLIGVFSMNGWIPIGEYNWHNGKAWVKNIETDQIYQPLIQTTTGWKESGYPFIPQIDGTVLSLKPNTMQRESIRLTRKHPLTQYWVMKTREMDGVRFLGNNIPDINSAKLLAISISDSIYNRECHLLVSTIQKYRYLWICPPTGKRLNIAEMSIYADCNFHQKLNYRVKECAPPIYNLIEHSIEKAFDEQNLTRYEAEKVDVPCMLDLKKTIQIGGIIYVPHNDDNYISPGDCYELFYQNGIIGWTSLGTRIAEFDYLEYDNVPTGALLWLHNRTKGVEEQVFLWEAGKQVFKYKLL
ncbi:hypothetical protein [uncultured Bacteroides sp.]|uniref:hypothetical protein n=1 Tax=uncultured Bacteroides sp. TaxID=162156 RepID=UPI0025F447D4|nr:hypothetical protein [uncultured Bacteroides sp.]